MKTLNKDFLDKFHKVLLERTKFIRVAAENGLAITEPRLSFYEQEEWMRPIAIHDNKKFYSLFQLFRIYTLEYFIDESLRRVDFARDESGKLFQATPLEIKQILDRNRKGILQYDDGDDEFYNIINILHHLEPFYSRSLVSITDHLEELGFDANDPQASTWFRDKRDSGIAQEVLTAHPIELDTLRKWQRTIASRATNIDPLAEWYHFLRNFGSQDRQKLKRLKGFASLAQHFYGMEETLRGIIEDIWKEKILNPHDIKDLRGGSWRIAVNDNGEELPCNKCGTKPVKLHSAAARHQDNVLCQDCMSAYFREMDETTAIQTNGLHSAPSEKHTSENISARTPLLCSNKMCGRLLLKGLNEGFILDSTLSGLLAVELIYGELVLRVKCKKCGEVTLRDISIGWDTSSGS